MSYVYRPLHPDANENGMIDRALVHDRPDDAPMVISDHLPAMLEHHGYSDGRRTDSKSTFRRWTRDAGLVEVGTEKQRRAPPPQDATAAREVKQAIEMLRSGHKPRTMPANFEGPSGDGWH